MREFFKPRRRKIGVMTLMLACVLAGLWLRSTVAHESVSIQACGFEIFLSAFKGEHYWTLGIHAKMESGAGGIVEYRSEPAHPEIAHYRVELGNNRPLAIDIPFREIVIPLTLLSAWLLLSKPRPKPTVDDAGDKVVS